jgi:hypothetical protein
MVHVEDNGLIMKLRGMMRKPNLGALAGVVLLSPNCFFVFPVDPCLGFV